MSLSSAESPVSLPGDIITARILIVDDETANVLLLQRILKHAGYVNVFFTCDAREVHGMIEALAPDIVLLDLHMPFKTGYDILAEIQSDTGRDAYLPVLVLTADITQDAKKRALTSGAKDFLIKPFDPLEVLLRTRILLETRALHLKLSEQNSQLGLRVVETTKDLDAAVYEIVHRLARAAEFRDDQTGQHTNRVANMAALVGEMLGLPAQQTELLRKAAPLHDIGKVGISDLILQKPGKLTPEEYDLMKTHTTIGSNILSGSDYPLLQMAEIIARTHHERWDGRGYHCGLGGIDIPLEGRILSVVDVFDALINERPYKAAWSWPDAIEEIKKGSGTQFDANIVEAFIQLVSEQKLHPDQGFDG